jgi:hypothetical protein
MKRVSGIVMRTCLAPKTKQVVHSLASLLSHHDGLLRHELAQWENRPVAHAIERADGFFAESTTERPAS